MRTKSYYVYIMASESMTLYIGVTSDLIKRMHEHSNGLVQGFTKKHEVKKLLYYEIFSDPRSAILREKKLKRWNRGWKLSLIQKINPMMKDLYEETMV